MASGENITDKKFKTYIQCKETFVYARRDNGQQDNI